MGRLKTALIDGAAAIGVPRNVYMPRNNQAVMVGTEEMGGGVNRSASQRIHAAKQPGCHGGDGGEGGWVEGVQYFQTFVHTPVMSCICTSFPTLLSCIRSSTSPCGRCALWAGWQRSPQRRAGH